jgi:hypothetical protein
MTRHLHILVSHETNTPNLQPISHSLKMTQLQPSSSHETTRIQPISHETTQPLPSSHETTQPSPHFQSTDLAQNIHHQPNLLQIVTP